MKFKIIVDSSSNLLPNDYKSDDIDFDVVPLIINIDNQDFIDDEKLDMNDFLEEMNNSKDKIKTSCPSPAAFLETFNNSDYYFVFTISQKLSGSYNSAIVAKNESNCPNNIFVLDSKLTAGGIELLVKKCIEEIKSNKTFDEICESLNKYVNELNLFFVLDNFDSLIKSGRINKVLAFIINLANIKPLCYAENGEIKIKEKIRTLEGVFKRLVANIGNVCSDITNKILIISYTKNKETALKVKSMIEKVYKFKEILIRENRGLCSYYSSINGIICSF